MTEHAVIIVDKATIYRVIQSAPAGHRYEFVRGRIVDDMTGGTLAQAKIARRFATAFEARFDGARWEVTNGSDGGVDTVETVHCPDVVVEAAGALDDSLSTTEPVVIVELLSQSSGERDLAIKPAECFGLSSLLACVVASQRRRTC